MPEPKAFVIVQILINDRDSYHQYETAEIGRASCRERVCLVV